MDFLLLALWFVGVIILASVVLAAYFGYRLWRESQMDVFAENLLTLLEKEILSKEQVINVLQNGLIEERDAKKYIEFVKNAPIFNSNKK